LFLTVCLKRVLQVHPDYNTATEADVAYKKCISNRDYMIKYNEERRIKLEEERLESIRLAEVRRLE
jgi:hypothetical protein